MEAGAGEDAGEGDIEDASDGDSEDTVEPTLVRLKTRNTADKRRRIAMRDQHTTKATSGRCFSI